MTVPQPIRRLPGSPQCGHAGAFPLTNSPQVGHLINFPMTSLSLYFLNYAGFHFQTVDFNQLNKF